jgi:hypothetical protein
MSWREYFHLFCNDKTRSYSEGSADSEGYSNVFIVYHDILNELWAN